MSRDPAHRTPTRGGGAPPTLSSPQQEPSPAGYLSSAGAQRFASCSRRVRDYARSRGELPYLRRGRKVLYSVSDLQRWIESARIDVQDDLVRLSEARRLRKGGAA